MPLVRLEVRQGRSATQKRALLDAAHAALVEALRIPDDDRMQRLVEHARDDFELPPGRSDDFVLVEVTLFAAAPPRPSAAGVCRLGDGGCPGRPARCGAVAAAAARPGGARDAAGPQPPHRGDHNPPARLPRHHQDRRQRLGRRHRGHHEIGLDRRRWAGRAGGPRDPAQGGGSRRCRGRAAGGAPGGRGWSGVGGDHRRAAAVAHRSTHRPGHRVPAGPGRSGLRRRQRRVGGVLWFRCSPRAAHPCRSSQRPRA